MNFYSKFTFVGVLSLLLSMTAFANGNLSNSIYYDVCDDLTNGGVIHGDQAGCANPTFDPSLITNVILPSGGSGDIEYVWISTTDNPASSTAVWTPISDTNTSFYDPTPISVTTYYRRCARRSGCDQYLAESNYVTVTMDCENAEVGNFVWLDANNDGIQQTEELGIENVEVTLTGTDLNGNPYTATTFTDENGYYIFTNLPAGNYMIQFALQMDLTFSPMNTTSDDLDSDVNIATGKTDMFEVLPGSSNMTFDAGMYNNCNNVLNGGLIGPNITNCGPLGPTTIMNVSTPDGGSGNIEYQWYKSYTNVPFSFTAPDWFLLVGATSATYMVDNSAQNTYYTRVARSVGCNEYVGISNMTSIIIHDNIEFEATIVDETCDNDGSISINVTQGAAPFNYTWSPAQGNTSTISSLGDGWYYLTISDSNGCTLETLLDVQPGTAMELSTSTNDVSCFNGNDGTATVNASGGVEPYTYEWDVNTGNQNTQTATNLSAGSYSVVVTDANDCSSNTTVNISQPTLLVINQTISQGTCNLPNGSISATASGGTPGYTYDWSTNYTPGNTLAAGDYTLTVTDAHDCTTVETYTINASQNMTATIADNDVTCFGLTNGSATINVDGGQGPFTYSWTNTTQTTATISNLAPNTYIGTVTDVNGCQATASTTITSPSEITVTPTVTHDYCGQGNGSISLDVNGGTPNYTYLWGDNSTASSISNLTGGITYTVTITDANGCTIDKSYSIDDLGGLSIAIGEINVTCYGASNGSATVNITAGQAPYTYAWDANTGNQNTQTATNLSAGSYSVVVTDANNCSANATVNISQPTEIVITESISHTSCNLPNGSISATANGGTPGYTYDWSANYSTGNTLGAGNYTLTVTDANNCTKVETYIINASQNMTATIADNDVTCFGLNNGSATISVDGGQGPFTYSWTNTTQSTATITNLSPNTYIGTVTDINGCQATASTTITSPSEITVTPTVTHDYCGQGNGSISLDVTGGTPGYTFLWQDNSTTSSISNLTGGVTYTVTITDANGCSIDKSYSLQSTGDVNISISNDNVSCYGGNDGSASISIISGQGPFTYEWSSNTDGQTTATVTNLSAGSYSVTATDSNGCDATATTTVTEPTELVCSASVTSDYNGAHLSSIGICDGSAEVVVSGGTAPYTVLWSNNDTSFETTDLCAGTYTVEVTDANGCTCTSTVQLFEPCIVQGFIWEDTEMDNVQNPSEEGIANVEVTLTGTDLNGNTVTLTTTTDANGMYSFDPLLPGTYTVTTVTNIGDLMMVDMDSGSDDTVDSDFNATTGSNTTFTIDSGETLVFDGGFSTPTTGNMVSIGDNVWFDINQNGIQDIGEPGQNNVLVSLYELGPDMIFGTADDIFIGSQLTYNISGVGDGYYTFNNIPEGNYVIVLDEDTLPNGGFPGNTSATTQDAGSNDDTDSDINANYISNVVMVTLTSGDVTNLDAGYIYECNPLTYGGEIAEDELLCGDLVDPALIYNVALPAGGFGNIEYIWMMTTDLDNTNPMTWTPIPTATEPSYDPGPITQTTRYIRCARNEGCEVYGAESNSVTKTVQPAANAEINGPESICLFESADFEATLEDGATYTWDFGNNATPATAEGQTINDVSYTSIGFKEISLTVDLNGCTETITQFLHVQSCGLQMPLVTSFTLSSDDKTVITLDWKVENELPLTKYLVEHSRDNDIFEVIGQLDGNGPQALNNYTFVDESPRNGKNFYRIRQHSFAIEDYNFSEVLEHEFLPAGSKRTAVYPNPFINATYFEILDVVDTELDLYIVDMLGKVLEHRTFEIGTQSGRLDLTNYQDGVYFLYFKYNGFRESTQKVFKVK